MKLSRAKVALVLALVLLPVAAFLLPSSAAAGAEVPDLKEDPWYWFGEFGAENASREQYDDNETLLERPSADNYFRYLYDTGNYSIAGQTFLAYTYSNYSLFSPGRAEVPQQADTSYLVLQSRWEPLWANLSSYAEYLTCGVLYFDNSTVAENGTVPYSHTESFRIGFNREQVIVQQYAGGSAPLDSALVYNVSHHPGNLSFSLHISLRSPQGSDSIFSYKRLFISAGGELAADYRFTATNITARSGGEANALGLNQVGYRTSSPVNHLASLRAMYCGPAAAAYGTESDFCVPFPAISDIPSAAPAEAEVLREFKVPWWFFLILMAVAALATNYVVGLVDEPLLKWKYGVAGGLVCAALGLFALKVLNLYILGVTFGSWVWILMNSMVLGGYLTALGFNTGDLFGDSGTAKTLLLVGLVYLSLAGTGIAGFLIEFGWPISTLLNYNRISPATPAGMRFFIANLPLLLTVFAPTFFLEDDPKK